MEVIHDFSMPLNLALSLKMRASRPLLAITGILCGLATAWTHKIYNLYNLGFSDNWVDHVEPDHSSLTHIIPDSLWQISASYMTIKKFRNMTIYKLPTGGLLLHSPIALPDDMMKEIEGLGTPKLIMIPNASRISYIDVAVYKNRYPTVEVACPSSLWEQLEKENIPVTTSTENVASSYDMIKFIEPPLKNLQENVMDISLPDGNRALVWGELLSNIRFFPGLLGKLFIVTSLAGDGVQPQLPLTHQLFGFEKHRESSSFFHSLLDDMKKSKSDPEFSLKSETRTVPIYTAMTFQHGNPAFGNCAKKIQKIADYIDNKTRF